MLFLKFARSLRFFQNKKLILQKDLSEYRLWALSPILSYYFGVYTFVSCSVSHPLSSARSGSEYVQLLAICHNSYAQLGFISTQAQVLTSL